MGSMAARGRAASGRIGGAMALTMSPPAMVMAAPASVCAHVAVKSRGGTTMAATSTPICRMVRSGFLSPPPSARRGAQRHDLAALERGLAPRRAGHGAAVHGDGYLRPTAGRFCRAPIGATLEGGYPFLLDQIGDGGADRAPTRVKARRKRTGAHRAPLGRQSMGPEIGCYELFGRPAAGLLEGDIARPSGGLIDRARRGARQGGYLHR